MFPLLITLVVAVLIVTYLIRTYLRRKGDASFTSIVFPCFSRKNGKRFYFLRRDQQSSHVLDTGVQSSKSIYDFSRINSPT